MNGNNKIDIATKSAGAYFDMDNDGLRDATAWVGKGDGLLVIDLAKGGGAGADGVIDQSSEVVFTNWVPGSTSDMAAVKAVFDTNGNGKLDAGDTRFGEFRIWVDKNGDGISQKGELLTLKEAGIVEIGLNPNNQVTTLKDGSKVTGISTVTLTNGKTTIAGDCTFASTATGKGADVLFDANGNPVSNTGTEILGNSGDNTLTGTKGNDLIYGGNGADTIKGGQGDDVLVGGDGKDNVAGNSGNDKILGGAGKDLLSGGDGSDSIYGGSSDDALYGGKGNDWLNGGSGDDRIDGGDGTDTASYSGASDSVVVDLANTDWQNTGGGGTDKLISIENVYGSSHDDVLLGNKGANVLSGAAGDDLLSGGEGNDTLYGGTGNDVLFGGAGNDTLNGGEGFDIASYATSDKAVTVDLSKTDAQDTKEGTDTLVSIEGVYGSSKDDKLKGAAFIIGSKNKSGAFIRQGCDWRLAA